MTELLSKHHHGFLAWLQNFSTNKPLNGCELVREYFETVLPEFTIHDHEALQELNIYTMYLCEDIAARLTTKEALIWAVKNHVNKVDAIFYKRSQRKRLSKQIKSF